MPVSDAVIDHEPVAWRFSLRSIDRPDLPDLWEYSAERPELPPSPSKATFYRVQALYAAPPPESNAALSVPSYSLAKAVLAYVAPPPRHRANPLLDSDVDLQRKAWAVLGAIADGVSDNLEVDQPQ